MEWYQYLAAFFSGAFLSNAIPHFVKGVCGDKFPTPFSKPPGKGLSTPFVNVLWGSLNIIIGYVLRHASSIKPGNHPGMAVFFVGFVLMAIMASKNFAEKYAE
jgi:hypothetical protein